MKGAIIGTKFSRIYNMSCAAWTGEGTFSNNGNNFTGTFKIYSQMTYYEGNFTMKMLDKRMAVISDMLRNPNRDPNNITHVQSTVYM